MLKAGQRKERDLTHKEQLTLAALQAHISVAGGLYQWGSTFTVYADGTSSNNGIYRLQYAKDDTSKTNPDNLLKIGDNDDTFSSGGGSYTFGNGLTESGGAVVLGDTISSTVLLENNTNGGLLLDPDSGVLGAPVVLFGGASDLSIDSSFITLDGSALAMAVYDFSADQTSQILMSVGSTSPISINSEVPGFTGVVYTQNNINNFISRSLIDKEYSDSFLGGNALDSTVISPGATQDTGIIGWNQSNQEYEFLSNIGLGVGASGSTRSIDALGTSSDIQLQLNAKGNGSVVLSGFNQIFTNSGGNSVIITPGATATINPNGDESLLISAGVSSTGKGELLTLSGGAAHDIGDNDGGDLLLQGGASNGSGLRGSVQIKQIFKTITTTTYEVEESDWGKRLKFTNAAGCAVTLPNGLSDGLEFAAKRDTGAGVVSFAAATTLLSSGTEITTVQDWASVVHEGSDVWHAAGLT